MMESHLISLIAIVIVWNLNLSIGLIEAQVIRLHHPESLRPNPLGGNLLFNPTILTSLNRGQNNNNHHHHRQQLSSNVNVNNHQVFTNNRAPNNLLLNSQEAARRRTPKSGNVVVRFDSNKEIERIQYVLQNGQLATIYKREQTTQFPLQQQQQQQDLEKDTNLISKSMFIEDSASKEMFPIDEQQQNQMTFEMHQLENDDNELGLQYSEPKSEFAEILANIVSDSMELNRGQENGQAMKSSEGLRKIGGFLKKLKNKIKSKFKMMPQIVQKKLNAKSSNGKLFVDRESGERVPIELENEQHQEMLNNPMNKLQLQ